MRNTTAFGDGGLRGAYLKVAKHRHRVAIDDLSAEMLGQGQREGGLSTSGGT